MKNGTTERAIDTVAARRTRLGKEEFSMLPFDDKLMYLAGVPPKDRVSLILGDPDSKKLTWSMHP